MSNTTLYEWIGFFFAPAWCAILLYGVRIYVVFKIRNQAIDAIVDMSNEYIANGIKYEDSIWEKFGFRSNRDKILNRQLISLRKWNFEDFYPDLTEWKGGK